MEKEWIYKPGFYCEHREVLGYKGECPLLVVGVNPSTAEPNNLDPTLQSVERIAQRNGFDSFLMINLYPQRATNPNEMHKECNEELRQLNKKAIEELLQTIKEPEIWCAWGNLIEKRKYLKDCLQDLLEIGNKYNAKWMCAGPLTKKGYPHHPLYLPKDTELENYRLLSDNK